MSTTTIALEPQNLAAAAQSLRTEFLKAKISGVKASAAKDAVQIQIPIARLADYQFACADAYCSWSTSHKKIVVEVKGFSVEQKAKKNFFLLIFRHSGAPKGTGRAAKSNPIREAFFRRSLRAIEELQAMDERKLAEAVQAPTDYSVLVSALTSDEALATIRARDPLAGARLRGIEAKRQLLEAEGGSLSSAETSKLLKISRQAVDKRRRENKILGLELGKKGYHYPTWQFGLRNLDDVLSVLGDRDEWEKLNFFLNPSDLLDDRTPLKVLQAGKGQLPDVINAAASYGEHGG
jgi:hypothetical protein